MMNNRHFKLRNRRGFSLLEAMVASAVLITSITGVAVMLVYTATNARESSMRPQMALLARQLVHERVSNGLANVGGNFSKKGVKVRGLDDQGRGQMDYDIEVIDTSQAGALPNLGYNSRLVRCKIKWISNSGRKGEYTYEAYVSE